MEFAEFDIEFLSLKLSENPQSPLFARLADLYLHTEKVEEAMKLLQEGIPQFPNYYASYIVLGKAHLALQEYTKAQAAFQKALEISPFNQTALNLLMSVPSKPDESVRTTEENYFTPTTETAEQTVDNPFESSVLQEETTVNVPETIFTDDFQTTISEPPQEVSTAFDVEPIQTNTYAQFETNTDLQHQDAFPSHDDYFAQHQNRIETESAIKLDDYLSGSHGSQNQSVITEPTIQQHEFAETHYQDTIIDQEIYNEPEVVVSSPEQAQLFAEMMGTNEQTIEQSSPSSDIDALAEKLQKAEKIVPQENYQPVNPPPSQGEEEKAYESDAVTPTLAEIYASQGEFRAAIQAYEILMFSQPAKGADFQKRISELQRLQMEKDGFV